MANDARTNGETPTNYTNNNNNNNNNDDDNNINNHNNNNNRKYNIQRFGKKAMPRLMVHQHSQKIHKHHKNIILKCVDCNVLRFARVSPP